MTSIFILGFVLMMVGIALLSIPFALIIGGFTLMVIVGFITLGKASE